MAGQTRWLQPLTGRYLAGGEVSGQGNTTKGTRKATCGNFGVLDNRNLAGMGRQYVATESASNGDINGLEDLELTGAQFPWLFGAEEVKVSLAMRCP